jgi:hypothetical protein
MARGKLMLISWEIIGIYVGMVIFGLIAYAYIIPYFVVRKIRKLVNEGWAAQTLGELIPQLINLKIILEDKSGEKHEVPLINYLVSVAIDNMKMQFASMKSAMIRGFVGGDGKANDLITGMDTILASVPKQWRWAAQLIMPFAMQKIAGIQSANVAPGTPGTTSPIVYKSG